ncbi:MAG: acyl-CoA thioester hydrolase [Paracoccaceae bacterium]|jgi:acyl-CoA thioester hydrolase
MTPARLTAIAARTAAEAQGVVRDLAAPLAMADCAEIAKRIADAGTAPADAPIPDFEAAALRTTPRQVPIEWIDYNGHMNVSYYTMAFDKAADEVYDNILLIGAEYARVQRMGPYVIQQHIHYLGELLRGDEFTCAFRILDCDDKRLHTWCDLIRVADGRIAASAEAMVMNVDLEERRSAPYPAWARARVAALALAQAELPVPVRVGALIGIRRG